MDFQTFVSDFMARQKRNESAATMKEQSSLLEASRQQDLDSRVVTTEQSTPEVKDVDALTAEPFSLEDPEPAMDSAIPSIPLGEIGQLAEPVEALRGSVVSPVAAHQQASSPGLNIDAVSPSSDAGEAASAAILMSDEVLRVEPSETVNGAMPEAVPEVLLRDPGQPAAAQEQASSEQLAADATTIGQSIGFTATPTPTITPPGFDAPDVNEPHRSPVETAEPSSQQQYPQIGTTPAGIHVSPQLQADINSRTDEISNPASATTATSDSAEGATTNEKIDATTHEVHAELPELFRSEGAVAAQHESAAGESADVSASERSVTDHAELSERTETQPHGVHLDAINIFSIM
ncbi:MAG: hypothetical protein GY826_14720, partial [Fuerstiella sp.]|nr:hypothetical protein [Fuerstiella sp.]